MKPNSGLYLKDIAQIVRSKNAGPFLITLDVIFCNQSDYVKFKSRNYLNSEIVQQLFGIREQDITEFLYFNNGNAIKVTIRRRCPSGSQGDTDIYGAQQHVPLLMMKLDSW